MKAAKDAGEEYYEPTREDNIRRRNERISALWEEHLKDPIVALDKALKCVEILRWRSRPECLAEGCLAMAGVGSLPLLWEKPIWEGVWPYWDPMDSVCLRTASMERKCAREVWAAWRALFLPHTEGTGNGAGVWDLQSLLQC